MCSLCVVSEILKYGVFIEFLRRNRLISSQVHSTTLPLLRMKYCLSIGDDSSNHLSNRIQVKRVTHSRRPYKAAELQAR